MSQLHAFTTATDADLARMDELRRADEFFWLDLASPDDATLERVGRHLGLHPLVVEDLQHRDQRPKVEEFTDYLFIVATAGVYVDGDTDRFELHEFGLIVHGDFLITAGRHVPEKFARLRELACDRGEFTEAALVHRVLDGIVDVNLATTEQLEDRVEELEATITEKSSPELLLDLRRCRRDLVRARSSALAQRDALEALASLLDQLPGFEQGMHDHFRDVVDHARRVVDDLEIARLLLDDAFEAYYTMLVARQGVVAQRLTVVATIFLPLTFVTGFFGQNFGWMVEHVSTRQDFLVYGVGTSVLTTAVLVLIFSRLRWW